ncbi:MULTISPECIES: SDR family NAD(P)-dependent oxidoreductase [unclassified Mesorhizobium]|uniref:SDR family NAD(P)-dependent oxidoreductase n=1 Tax=unclassified Mesorhizobium TaxID=325217 RepID=UPI000FE2BC5E|nr:MULTISPECIES: SDR family NAD(P)-dependent oxidoreductase [unclassified Mesorhizobium]RWQ13061.1 MAG: SDR family oxidoreductase [Mesorhizobium sp.]TGQ37782.1 SDR family oxidoreductase [Mesorhizobium sp. M4B.F.Ca.ET.214.01.1.1]TGQ59549.1 SDR family oxidoreductase [Mesorhizobium sp. M4B.F.Ca.ET.211.01.1.1]TGU34615.1 SDR family oxidoreductase [Mesorhizobium sp. M4B.F.Ca.ET.150.01.1.1]
MAQSKKVVIVTGATSGIGRAVVEAFAATGASLVLAGRDRERGQKALETVEKLGCTALLQLGDVADPAFADQVVRSAVERFGQVDVLVNSAGIIRRGNAVDTSDDDWRQTFEANVNGVFFFSRAAVRSMRTTGGGSIINVASNVGLVGCPGLVAYCASKGAVVLMTQAMALDHAKEQITINAVCPGAVDTPMLVSAHTQPVTAEQILQRNVDSIPQGRVATPKEIASLTVFLASEGARHITGVAIPIDGGFTAG